jgi:YD repeat-containing protein
VPTYGTTFFEYDLVGRLTAKTDAEGRTSRVRYDPLGRVIETTDALGRSAFLGYDEVGNLMEVSATGDRVRLEYDSRGLLLRRTAMGLDDKVRLR